MKFIFATLVAFSLSAVASSITCYRCGGLAPSGPCSSSNMATVNCADSSLPNVVFACQVYTVNYTTLNQVLDFKSCCEVGESCNEDPCKAFGKGTVCFNMASCQSDRCNYNYTTATMAGPPTIPSTAANIIFFHGGHVAALIIFVILYLFMWEKNVRFFLS